MAQGLFQPDRCCHVGQRVPAQRDERVAVGDVGDLQGVPKISPDTARADGGRAFVRVRGLALGPGQRQDSLVVQFARGQARELLDGVEFEGRTRQPHALGEDLAQEARVVVALDGDDEAVVRTGAGCLHAEVGQDPLHLSEVDAQSDDFDEPAAAAHDFVDARGVLPGEVTGAELRRCSGPFGEVRRRSRRSRA